MGKEIEKQPERKDARAGIDLSPIHLAISLPLSLTFLFALILTYYHPIASELRGTPMICTWITIRKTGAEEWEA